MDYRKEVTLMEREFSTVQAQGLSDAALLRFTRGRYSTKLSICQGKQLVLYSIVNGRPLEQTRLTLEDASFSMQRGVTLHMDDGHNAFDVGYTPVEVADSLFVWVPKFCKLERYSFEGAAHSKLGIAMRSEHSPQYYSEGSNYLVDQYTFAGL
jgi:hypothetical protein